MGYLSWFEAAATSLFVLGGVYRYGSDYVQNWK